jgi:hypothetical protein
MSSYELLRSGEIRVPVPEGLDGAIAGPKCGTAESMDGTAGSGYVLCPSPLLLRLSHLMGPSGSVVVSGSLT